MKASLEKFKGDSHVQFHALVLLDVVFQNLLPLPSYPNEVFREVQYSSAALSIAVHGVRPYSNREVPRSSEVPDLESLDFGSAHTLTVSSPRSPLQFEVTDPLYLSMRLALVLKVWRHVEEALSSSWSNIRSTAYGLFCSMLRVDLVSLRP